MSRAFLVGVGAGAALMYFFDPSWGRRRRAQLRERVESGSRQVDEWRERAELRHAHANVRRDGARDEADLDWSEGEPIGYPTRARSS